MNHAVFFRFIVSISAVLAAHAAARAGCNCNVPPSPVMSPVSFGGWNAGGASAFPAGPMAPMGMSSGYPTNGYPMSGYPSGYPSGFPTNGYPMTGGFGPTLAPVPGAAPNAGLVGPSPALPYGGTVATIGPHWAPGGYQGRVGSPAYYYDPYGAQYVVTGNPYYDHFGPGFHRNSIHGHYRFPYYDYRTPWYFPGRAVYNRNTNFAW